MTVPPQLEAVIRHFQLDGALTSAIPYGSGHINDTFALTFDQAGAPRRYILQRINPAIFPQPAALMENIERVTAHLAAQVTSEPDAARLVLTLVPARDARAWHVDPDNNYWRVYHFIEQAHTRDTIASPADAFAVAHAFGRFQQLLADLPGPPLHTVLPDFHHTPRRFAAFEQALAADSANRAREARPEIAFALARRPLASLLLDANLPQRITHNDTKCNNVLLDDRTGAGLCVIDLDTVMPGLALHDFGDLVRTATCPAPEDEPDLTRVALHFPLFEALARGYLAATAGFLTPAERHHLVAAARVITFEQGLRFLTDFLAGDPYYKVHRPAHNLDRCRTQWQLLRSIEHQQAPMERLIASLDA